MTSKDASTSEAKIEHTAVDFNYRALRILIFKNGEEYDNGLHVIISRRQFRHWIKLLDYLSKRLEMGAAIHKIYRLDGIEVNTFDELENNGCYVAVTHGPYIQLDYGTHLKYDEREKVKRWNYDPKLDKKECGSLDSAESIDIYLRRCGYESLTGLPFPFDELRCAAMAAESKTASQQNPVAGDIRIAPHGKPLLDVPKAKLSKVKDVKNRSSTDLDRVAEAAQNHELPQNTESKEANENKEVKAEKMDTQNDASQNDAIGQKTAPETNTDVAPNAASKSCITQETVLTLEEPPKKPDKGEKAESDANVEVLRYNPDHIYMPLAAKPAVSPSGSSADRPPLLQPPAKSPPMQPTTKSPFIQPPAKSPPMQPTTQPLFIQSQPRSLSVQLPAKLSSTPPSANSSNNDEDVDIPRQPCTSSSEKPGRKTGSIHFAAHPEIIEVPRYLPSPNSHPYLRKTSFYDTKKVRPPRPMYFDPDFSDFDFF